MCVPTDLRRKMIYQIIEALQKSPSFRDISINQIKEAVLNSEHQTFQQSKSKDEYMFLINEKIKKIQRNTECKNFDKNHLFNSKFTDSNYGNTQKPNMETIPHKQDEYSEGYRDFNEHDKAKIINGRIPPHVNISQMYSQDQTNYYSNVGRKMETFAASFEQGKRNIETNKNTMKYQTTPYQEYKQPPINKAMYTVPDFYTGSSNTYIEKPQYSYSLNNNQSYLNTSMQHQEPGQLSQNLNMQSNVKIKYPVSTQNGRESMMQSTNQCYTQAQPSMSRNPAIYANHVNMQSAVYSTPQGSNSQPNTKYAQYAYRSFSSSMNNGSYNQTGFDGFIKTDTNTRPLEYIESDINRYNQIAEQKDRQATYTQQISVRPQNTQFKNYPAFVNNEPQMNSFKNANDAESFMNSQITNEYIEGRYRSSRPDNEVGNDFTRQIQSENVQEKVKRMLQKSLNQDEQQENTDKLISNNKSFIGNINPGLYEPQKTARFDSVANKHIKIEIAKSNTGFDDKQSEEIFNAIGEEFIKSGRFTKLENKPASNPFDIEKLSNMFTKQQQSKDKNVVKSCIQDNETVETIWNVNKCSLNDENLMKSDNEQNNSPQEVIISIFDKNQVDEENISLFCEKQQNTAEQAKEPSKTIKTDEFIKIENNFCIKAGRRMETAIEHNVTEVTVDAVFDRLEDTEQSSVHASSNEKQEIQVSIFNDFDDLINENTQLSVVSETTQCESPVNKEILKTSTKESTIAFCETENTTLNDFLDSNIHFAFAPANDEFSMSELEVPEELSEFLNEKSLAIKENKNKEQWKIKLENAYLKLQGSKNYESVSFVQLLEIQMKFSDYCFLDEQEIDTQISKLIF